MVKIAKIKNHNLYIIIPPYRTDYREEMGEYVFENQKKILSEYIDVNNIIDCYKSISDEYFLNCDHLNSNGAIKLSILLNKQIEDEEKND